MLYDVELPGPSTLPASRRTASLPIEIGPANRFDEHAIGQATRPFDFGLQLRIGAADRLSTSIIPKLRGQAEITGMLERVCQARGRRTR